MRRLDEAESNNRLVVGFNKVWDEAVHHHGILFVVEKDYRYSGYSASKEEIVSQYIAPFARYSYIKDAVDDIIEKVLENGGDVEFVDKGVLKNYGRIALIKNF